MMSVGALMLMLLLPRTVVSRILDKLLYTGILELKDSSIRFEGSKMDTVELIMTVRNITVMYLGDIMSRILLLWSDSERTLD